jgi:hypothetical protein
MDARLVRARGAFDGETRSEEWSWASSKICLSSWSSSDRALVKCELGDAGSVVSSGSFAGVAALTRALGISGESERSSCSAVQHSLDAMSTCEEMMARGLERRRKNRLRFVDLAPSPRGAAAVSRNLGDAAEEEREQKQK